MKLTLKQLQEKLEGQEKIIAQLRAENKSIKKLHAEIKNLKERLEKDSTNSSKPPSTDSSKARKKRKKRPPSPLNKGGQPGHKAHKRTRLEPDEIIDIVPVQCTNCDHVFDDLDSKHTEPECHQFLDIPPVKAHVIDYMLHSTTCQCCGETSKAQTPPHVANNTYGTAIAAITSCLTGQFELSKRQAKFFLKDILGTKISLGTVCNLEARTAKALLPAYEEAKASVRADEVVHVDETTWWQKDGHHGWLWVAVGSKATLFYIHDSRNSKGLDALIGNFENVVVSDRMRVYASNKTIKNQWCFAHLLRDFQACAQRDGPVQELAENLEVGTRWLLKLDRFHRYPDSKHSLTKPDRKRMLDVGNELKRVFKIWLEKGSKIDGAPSWFRGLLNDYDGMWTWLTHENIPLTNNAAERALRRSVIARKKSYGTQSTTGDNFVSRMRTATETLRRCKSNVFSFIHSSLMASLLHTKPPLLLS